MFHAFEKMDIQDNKITSHRKNATLEAFLACKHGLTLSQTDQFDTPYNHGIPKAYHRQKPNHWHITTETKRKSQTTRIAAILSVHNTNERFVVDLQKMNGWIGVKAAGDFGRTEGWIRIDDVQTGPAGFDSQTANGKANLCGRSRNGEIFSA
jgi:hypothetical protein